MSRRNLILLAIAIVVVALVIPWGKKTATTQTEALVKVVVAKHDIAPYTVIESGDLAEQQVPASLVTSDAYDSWNELRDVRMISSTELRKGSILRRSEVLTIDDSSGWVTGETLITSFYVPTERIVGGQLRPGHHIDLLVTRSGQTDTAEALWLAYDLWVVGTLQVSGQSITRPTVALYAGTPEPEEKEQTTSSGLFGTTTAAIVSSNSTSNGSETSNLIVVAVGRETARMIAYYMGARMYDGWVYARPETMEDSQTALGRVEGMVYLDIDASEERDADEVGLADVPVTLRDDAGKLYEAETDSSGSFGFDALPAGVYEIEETDLPGYASSTANRKTLYLVGDQTLSVYFGDTATGNPAAGTSQTAAEAATPSSASTAGGAASQATPVPPSCRVQLVISDQENGQSKQTFQEGVSTVWALLTFEGCSAGTQYTLSTRDADTRADRQIATGVWDGTASPIAVKITPHEGLTQFAVGTYTTSVWVGAEQSVQSYVTWYVDALSTSSTQPNNLPTSGFGYDQDSR